MKCHAECNVQFCNVCEERWKGNKKCHDIQQKVDCYDVRNANAMACRMSSLGSESEALSEVSSCSFVSGNVAMDSVLYDLWKEEET